LRITIYQKYIIEYKLKLLFKFNEILKIVYEKNILKQIIDLPVEVRRPLPNQVSSISYGCPFSIFTVLGIIIYENEFKNNGTV